MATHDYVIDNASGSAVRTDLNNVFQAILTNNSSGSAPSTTAAYMLWADTSNNILKMRNSADNAWINLFTLSGGVDVDAASNFAAAVTFTDDVTFDGATAGRDIVFDRSDNALEFADNAKATFGTGADLEIFHDGSNSIIFENGTGVLQLATAGASVDIVKGSDASETMAKFIINGANEFYFDNAKKAETVTGGFTVTGTCTATAFAGDGSALTGVGGGVTSDSQSNTVAGTGAGGNFSGTSAEENTLFGKDAGSEINTGDNNSAFGREALGVLESGSNNTAMGHNALSKCLSSDNTACGQGALGSLTSGTSAVAVGHGAGLAATSASNFVAIGTDALMTMTTGGSGNVAVGKNAGKLVTTAYGTVAVGESACDLLTEGYFNNAIGKDALGAVTTGVQNCAMGVNALLNVSTGNHNVAIGTYAGQSMTTGNSMTVVGTAAGANRTANNLTAIGSYAAYSSTTADQNTAVGDNVLYANQTGGECVAVGTNALYSNTVSANTAVGRYSGMLISTGTGNSSFGYMAGYGQTTGSGNISIAGAASSATASNECTLGGSGITTLRCNDTSISSLSDQRDKTDIVDLPIGLAFLNTLKPRQFKWATREGNIKDNTIRAGFIAQELQESEKNYRYLKLVHDHNEDRLEANEGHLIPLLVKAIQELSVKVTALEAG